jgi:selenophosphate synthase
MYTVQLAAWALPAKKECYRGTIVAILGVLDYSDGSDKQVTTVAISGNMVNELQYMFH